ncbi:MAG: hypothetical protein HY052_04340 [Proteobacteria bacterium]|nr:hypothetical protein [Pseudomonadota bacterium]
MTQPTIEQVLEKIYTSLQNNNEELDLQIQSLKAVMSAEGRKSVEVIPSRLVQNNRQGRKMMLSYFKKRGVMVTFPDNS